MPVKGAVVGVKSSSSAISAPPHCDNFGNEFSTEEPSSNTNDDCLTNLNWLVQAGHNSFAPNLNPNPSSSTTWNGRGRPCCCPPNEAQHNAKFCKNGHAYSTNTAEMRKDIDYKKVPVKPPYSYAQLIIMAMNAHGNGKVLLSDIYAWIRDNFCFYKTNDTSWQNSVRHNLSLNKQFVKVPRDASDKGKGSYWMLEQHNKDPYCIRRRNFQEPQHRRNHRPEVDKPQINPAVKTFLEKTQRQQEARRHPFSGTGEQVEDIGAQECVVTDSDPIFDDFNMKMFKKDVELYDPVYQPNVDQQGNSNMVALPDISQLHSDLLHDSPSEPRVRVECLNTLWDNYTDLHSNSSFPCHNQTDDFGYNGNGTNPNVLETVIRIPSPTPEWWTNCSSQVNNLSNGTSNLCNFLLSPNNYSSNYPLAKIFENLSGHSPMADLLNHRR